MNMAASRHGQNCLLKVSTTAPLSVCLSVCLSVNVLLGVDIDGGLAEWNGVAPINEVTLRRARLVLGWVTVREFEFAPSRYLIDHPAQLSLAIPFGRPREYYGHGHC